MKQQLTQRDFSAQGQRIMNPVIYPQSAGLGKQQLTHGGKESL